MRRASTSHLLEIEHYLLKRVGPEGRPSEFGLLISGIVVFGIFSFVGSFDFRDLNLMGESQTLSPRQI